MSLSIEHVNKWFGPLQAITDLSMEVEEGALFGLPSSPARGLPHDCTDWAS